MKASEVLREAKNVLFERGWHQGSLKGPGGSLCSLGAISEASLTLDRSVAAVECIGGYCAGQGALEDAIGNCVPIWNDAPGRTFDEVVEAFDKAEKLALIAEEND